MMNSGEARKDTSQPDRDRKRLNAEIVFQGIDSIPKMQRFVFDEVERLERIFGRMQAWHIVLEAPERRHPHTGPLFNVTIQVALPSNAKIVVQEHPTELENPHNKERVVTSMATTAPAAVGQTNTPSANEGDAPANRRCGSSSIVQ